MRHDTRANGVTAGPGVAYGLVFLSGFAALVYELLWFRQLGLVFGNTAQAAATVLAAFMAGLAIGAGWARRRAARIANPLRAFGLIEIGIGAYAWIVPASFALVSAGYRVVALHVSDAPALLTAVRFALALLALLVPTVLMGASLPVLAEGALRSRERFATRLGLLYGSNTAGATLGVLACGFLLIPGFGIRASSHVAAAVNVAVGIAAWMLGRHGNAGSATVAPRAAAESATRPLALLATAAACGFLALGFETVWFRALVLVFGSTSHSFAIMVAGFLVGIALGSAALGRLAEVPRRSPWVLAAALAFMGLWTCVSMRLYAGAPEQFLRMLVHFGFTWGGSLTAKSCLAALILLPLAAGSGVAFTAVVRLVRERTASSGDAVGGVFAWNSLGCAAGAAVAGFVMLPAAGIERSLLALGAASILLGAAVVMAHACVPLRQRIAVTLLVIAAASALRWTVPAWDPLLLCAGAYFSPTTHVEDGRVVLSERLRSVQLLFYREGAAATVAATRTPDGRVFFSSDGKVEADTSVHDMALQRMMGHLPMLLHPNPRRVLNIGLGAGVTAGALTCYPGVTVDVAEIEPAVTNVAALFAVHNHDVLRYPDLRLFFNDGRNHLLLTTNRYDVITSDPFEPVVAGAASLYTVNHFRTARARLAPGGVMAQFLPLYELSRADLLMVLRSFLHVFPRSFVFFTGKDTVLLGLTEGADMRLDTAARKFDTPAVRASLETIGVNGPERLLDMLIMSFTPGVASIPEGPVIDDDCPLIEFTAPRSALTYRPDDNLHALLQSFREIPPALLAGLPAPAAESARLGHRALQDLLRAGFMRSSGDVLGAARLMETAAREAPLNPIIRNEWLETLSILAWQAQRTGRMPEAQAWYEAVLKVNPADFWALHNLAQSALGRKDVDAAMAYLERGLAAHPEAAVLLALRGTGLAMQGDLTGAARDLGQALRSLPRRRDIRQTYAQVLDGLGREAESAQVRAEDP